ncbi:hypothetical protein AMS68_006032 [Peltaster fructicola]|uniref:Tafazzin family protein n=1 Tax=Peltaster fructicola TaxID=286661 RepID=A0A6H0Y0T2_9PEZI|nr:hypothetical protein AMS68_006032 [Peltaster fructicola]
MVEERPYQPPWTTRATSALTIGVVGLLCRSFLFALNRTEVYGLEKFLHLVDSRKDPEQRQRGLITVANHVSVMDEPVIWGAMPFKYHWDTNNNRYSLASYDIMFNKGIKALDQFFYHGNTLPTHRGAHSQPGGPFQPTMREMIRLLSNPHGKPTMITQEKSSWPTSDPFSDAELTYTTNGKDIVPAYSAYPSRKYSWVHIFPEGKIHQHPEKHMRYFKWGIARLILESEPCPDVVPIWIDGMQEVMDDKRPWPRPMPRAGKDIKIYFGDLVEREAVFGGFRERWRQLKEKARSQTPSEQKEVLGEVNDDFLRYSPEAEQLRIDVTMAVRNEVLKLRRSAGLSDEDPKAGLAETWRIEGSKGKAEGEMADGSIVRDV